MIPNTYHIKHVDTYTTLGTLLEVLDSGSINLLSIDRVFFINVLELTEIDSNSLGGRGPPPSGKEYYFVVQNAFGIIKVLANNPYFAMSALRFAVLQLISSWFMSLVVSTLLMRRIIMFTTSVFYFL
uniref:Uncharacterized protein n=1 Tax=Cacopsylla melanoneura TaxID=428564 RepID=A0A8D8R4R2_9HEMI